jgi:hypothetical protein
MNVPDRTPDMPETSSAEPTRAATTAARASLTAAELTCCKRRTGVARRIQAGASSSGRRGARWAFLLGTPAVLATVCLHSTPAAAEPVDNDSSYLMADVSTIGRGGLDISADDYDETASSWVAPGVGVTYRYRPTRMFTLGAGLAGEVLLSDDADAKNPRLGRLELSAGVLVPMSEHWQLDVAIRPGVAAVAYDSFFRGLGPSVALRGDVTDWVSRDFGLTMSGVLLGAVVHNQHHEGDHAFNDSTGKLASAELHLGLTWRQ